MSASLVNLVRHTVKFQSYQKILTGVSGYGGLQQPVRFASNKHYDPRGRKYRRKKTTLIEMHQLLNMKDPEMDTPDKVRMHMKQYGLLPRKIFSDQIDLSSTSATFDEFVPPEGDGKSSLLSVERGKDLLRGNLLKGRNLKDRRKLKQYDTAYNDKSFAEMAQAQLVKTYTLLQDVKSNENELHQLVTNLAYPKLVFGLEFKTFRWKFIESIEPPRVVHVRVEKMLTDDNLYAQVTVRCHTKQLLTIYDRFGRLMYGSETVPRDVLEYVVFEKHIVNMYGEWRMHNKITPKWMPPQAPQVNTRVKPDLPDTDKITKEMNEMINATGTGGDEEAEKVQNTK
ncbi:39S ribosomal protein L45, mitochondrial-like [Pecten maximus]|uniref:39S ribosomal protein L45, mitochondrial-like n=1 Tax=Pecten maximus TaxID=6579 RepID=UPI001457F0E3|nr:39S ribosomal protein L45, mitochondrial-like [Pecten maximus]